MNKKEIKKSILIISLCMVALLFLSAIITVIVINFQKYDELSSAKGNILYYSESENHENENVLIVGMDDKNEINQDNTVNEQNENKDTKTTKNNTKQTVDPPYYIKVNYQENVVTIYKKDSSGNYTVPIKAMLCSCGDYTPPCAKYPDTIYKIPNTKYVWGWMQGNVWAQYTTKITGNILFHSVPYTKKDKSTLEFWEYDKLGTSASLGCIRLTVQDAKWIYDNCMAGTTVEFYASSNPGPLGKPTAQKISEDEEVRGWDPTDPDKNNPWVDYLKKKTEETAAIEKEKTQETTAKPAEENKTNIQEENVTTANEIEINENNNNNITTTNTTIDTNTTDVESNNTNTVEDNNTVNSNTVTNTIN